MPCYCSAEGPTSCSAARPLGQGNHGCSLGSCRWRSTSPRGAPGRADALPSVCPQRPCARPCVPASTVASASTTASRATPPIPAPASQASRGGRATWVSFCRTPPFPTPWRDQPRKEAPPHHPGGSATCGPGSPSPHPGRRARTPWGSQTQQLHGREPAQPWRAWPSQGCLH